MNEISKIYFQRNYDFIKMNTKKEGAYIQIYRQYRIFMQIYGTVNFLRK